MPEPKRPQSAPEHCAYCGREIRVMAFKRTGWCSDRCRKALGKDDA